MYLGYIAMDKGFHRFCTCGWKQDINYNIRGRMNVCVKNVQSHCEFYETG